MRVSDFHFDLPDELIARYPKEDRSSCRLLQLNGENGEISHRTFTDVLDLIDEGDLLIFNNTRVIPARMFGRKVNIIFWRIFVRQKRRKKGLNYF